MTSSLTITRTWVSNVVASTLASGFLSSGRIPHGGLRAATRTQRLRPAPQRHRVRCAPCFWVATWREPCCE